MIHVVIALAMVAGCSGPAVHPSISEARPIPLPGEWTACRADLDCVAVEMDCCDHCNGGWVLAVNRGHVAPATSVYHARCDARERLEADGTVSFCGPSCTELGCGAIGQRCASGRCTWTWDAAGDDQFVDQPNLILPARLPGGPSCP